MLNFGLYLLLILIIIRPQDFVPGIKGQPVVFGLMAVLLSGWILSPVDKRFFRTPQDKFVGLLFICIIISTISVNWISYSVDITVETIKIAFIYFFAISVLENENKFMTASWVMIGLMTIVALMGILQYFDCDITGAGMAWAGDKKGWQIRGIGNFDNPNDLAYSVVLIVPFALGLMIQLKNITKIFAILLLAISVYCIYLTKSRGGLLALSSSIFVWWYLWVSGKTLKRFAVFIMIIGLLSASVIQTKDYRDDSSSMDRIEAWVAGMSMLESHPFIGVGKGQFIEHHNRDSHSSYVRAGAELGVPGLYAFVGILYFTFFSLFSIKNNKNTEKWKIYYAGYGGFIGTYATASLFSTRTYDIVFLLVVGFSGVLSSLAQKESALHNEEISLVENKRLWNKYVFALTIITIVVWKLFLIQVW